MNVTVKFVAILMLVTMSVIILLIACFNLTNTTIALTIKRLKEIGVRKVVGARQFQIISQHLLEIAITISLAIAVGIGISLVMVPEFMAMWGIAYGLEDLSYLNLFATLIMLLFVCALLGGAYPALINSKFKPVVLLKGGSKVKGTNALTRLLLVTQFSLSVIVLVAGIIFTLNGRFQRNVDMGYDLKRLLVLTFQGEEEYNGIRNAIASNPSIEAIAPTSSHIGFGSYANPINIDTTRTTTQVYHVGANYFDVMGMNVLTGRNYIEGSELDYEKSLVIDKAFVDFHGLEEPLGTKINFQESSYEVVGVVDNHFDDLWKEERVAKGHIFPLASPDQYRRAIIRVFEGADPLEIDKSVETSWKETFPGRPYESRTQEDVVIFLFWL